MTNWWDPPWTGSNAPTPSHDVLPAPEPAPPVEPPTVPTGVTNTEPVALGGALMGVVSAALAVLVEFDVWHPTDHEISLVLVLLTSLITFVTVLQRGKAWSPASVAKLVADKGGPAGR